MVGQIVNDAEVIGPIDEMSSFYLEYTKIFIAIGNNKVRKNLFLRALEIGYEVVTLISSKAIVSKYAEINIGSIIFPNAVIEANVILGKGSIVGANTTINHDAVMKDYCLVNTASVIRPNVKLRDFGHISSRCLISADVDLGPNSFIADGSIVREGDSCTTKE